MRNEEKQTRYDDDAKKRSGEAVKPIRNWSVACQVLSFIALSLVLFHSAGFFPGLPVGGILSAAFALLGVNLALQAVFLTAGEGGKKKALKASSLDHLTQLLNQKSFEAILNTEMRRAGRYQQPLALCTVGLDDFKAYGEKLGLQQANDLLRDFARILSGTVRETDIVARREEDQFFILLPHTDIVRAGKFLSRLQAHMEEHLDCTFSAGATTHHTGETRDILLGRAIEALGKAKQEGRKKIRCIVANDCGQATINF